MEIALTGQGAMQAPQPVHFSTSITGIGLPPKRGEKRMARAAQKSSQERHSTPRSGKQLAPIRALCDQASCPSARTKACGWQALTQSPQKVHSPRLKSTVGKPPSPLTIICSGQAPMQSLQRVQTSVNNDSGSAQGGRISALGRGRPRKKPRRLASTTAYFCSFIFAIPLRSI